MDELNDEARRDRILIELHRLAWSKGLSEESMSDIAQAGEYVQLQEGDVLHRADQKLTAVFFIVNGRLQATALDSFGKEVLQRYLVRGAHSVCFRLRIPNRQPQMLSQSSPPA